MLSFAQSGIFRGYEKCRKKESLRNKEEERENFELFGEKKLHIK